MGPTAIRSDRRSVAGRGIGRRDEFNHIPTWPEWQRASASSMQIRAMKPKLVKIDDLVKKYHQALDMSKLNILMELRKAIEDWAADKIDRNADTGRLEAMQALSISWCASFTSSTAGASTATSRPPASAMWSRRGTTTRT